MASQYDIKSTSRDSARVQDIVISDPAEVEQARTRRIARSLLVNNIHDSAASVQLTLMHQKRHTIKAPWQDANSFSLATLKAGQQIRLELSAGQTYRLYQALHDLYALSEGGVPQGKRRFAEVGEDGVVVDIQAAEVIKSLLANDDAEFWAALNELQPDLLAAAALKKQHEQRCAAVAQFRAQLEAAAWSEDDWQKFFEANTWIFGHSLDYRFLKLINGQPGYGGVTVTGAGGQRGDFLMSTAAQVQFTVLVDIKKPQSYLLTARPYRNKVYGLSPDLVGGIAQLQSNCRTWVIDGSRQEENRELLDRQGVFTYEPKGILIIGTTEQLDEINKRATFELFRRNLHNPEVITYDELLARAEFLTARQTA
jgi:hypothetical protein